MLLVVLFLVILVLGLFYKEWKITSFDPALAASIGIPVLALHYVFMTLVSITTVAAFDAVGAIMVVAMLIIPAASAYLWTDRFHYAMLSAFFGVFQLLWDIILLCGLIHPFRDQWRSRQEFCFYVVLSFLQNMDYWREFDQRQVRLLSYNEWVCKE